MTSPSSFALAGVLLCGLSMLAPCARSHAQETRQLEGLAAVVGALAPGPGTITLLHSDVELRARMSLLRQSTLERALATLPEGLLRASLDELLGEALIALEARRLGLTPSAAALASERERFVGSSAEMRELLATLGVVERELRPSLERRALVSAFMNANLEGTLDLSASELERLFETERHPFAGRSLEEVRGAFSAWLLQRSVERAVTSWVDSLRERTPHRVSVGYGS